MSISSLLSKNNYNLNANSFNCETINNTKGQVITENNTIGQVLKITNINPNEVEFQDESGGSLPDTVGYPDGYVLKILDNTQNTYTWAQDSTGGTVPLILTGDAVNALQVRNTLLEASLTVDTTTSTVQLQGITRVEGVDDLKKFGVYNDADSLNPEFVVDTLNHQVKIGAYAEFNNTDETVLIKNTANVNKFKVENSLSQPVFKVDTNDNYVESYADQTFCAGLDQTNKFAVYSSTDPFPTFSVDTNQSIVSTRFDGSSNIKLVPFDNKITISDSSNSNTSSLRLENTNDSLSITHTNDGTNISKIQCTNLNVESTKFFVIGTGSKDKFGIKTPLGNTEFKINTNTGNVNVILDGGNETSKFRVMNNATSQLINVDTVNNIVSMSNNLIVNNVSSNDKFIVSNTTGNVMRADTVNTKVFFGNSNEIELNPNGGQILIDHPTSKATIALYNSTQLSDLKIFATNSPLAPNTITSNQNLLLYSDQNLQLESVGNMDIFGAGMEINSTSGPLTLLGDSIILSAEGVPQTITISGNPTITGTTTIPTGSVLQITDLPTVNTNATNKLYVDTKFSSPSVPSNIMTYVNELPGSGTLPSVVSPTAQVAFSQFVWTGATLITPTPLNFTVVSPGVLRYDGTDTRWFNINVELGLVSTAADQLVQLVLIDEVNAIIPATLSQFYTSTTDRNGGTSVNITLQLSNLNQIKIAVRTPRAATSLTLENYKLQIIEN